MSVGNMNPNAWNNWYHCIGSTYGTWLRGDPRGFRTFHHREHVEGDYRNPPKPGVWEPVFEVSRKTLRYPPVVLKDGQRRVACSAMLEKLEADGVESIALAIATNHFHLLARFPLLSDTDSKRYTRQILEDGRDPAPRYHLSRARRNASFALSSAAMKPTSPVWAARPKCEPIRDRSHQVNTANYIAGHVSEGAAVWVMGRGFLFGQGD